MIVFRRKNRRLFVTPAHFSLDRTEIGIDRIFHPFTQRALQPLPANSECLRFSKQDRFQFSHVFQGTDHAQDDTGTIFLHLNRCRIDIQSTGSQ